VARSELPSTSAETICVRFSAHRGSQLLVKLLFQTKNGRHCSDQKSREHNRPGKLRLPTGYGAPTVALLGPPKGIRGNKLTFEWESREAMTKEQKEAESKTFNSPITDAYYDVQDTIEVTLTDSKVVEFGV
jgi:hypothetical protein